MRSSTTIVGNGVGPSNPISAGYVSSAMFGSLLNPVDTGIYSFPSQVGIGTAGIAANGLRVGGTATGPSPRAVEVFSSLVAGQNGDTLAAVRIESTPSAGAFTGVFYTALQLVAKSVATFTSPADPAMITVGVLTGTGATNAYGILIAPPTGATNNYLIAHTTPATFNVKASGFITTASHLIVGGATADTAVIMAVGASGETRMSYPKTNEVQVHVRPNAGKAGAISFTEDAVNDYWAIGTIAASGTFRFSPGATVTAAPVFSITQAGVIQTATPTGGTAAGWRLGTVASVSPTAQNRTIEVEVGGTLYYLTAKTTNN